MPTPVPDLPPTLPPAPPVSAEAETLAPSSPPAEFPAGVPVIPGYEVLSELGRGGMGVVYKARQVKLNRLVALKMILAGGHAGEADLLRFKAEAEAVARLQHSHIVQIHEVGESEGRPFFSLEFVEGGSLAARLDGAPWAPRPASEMVRTLAQAMHAAHQQGIIHRDLKPANVLLAADGSPKITDFGLAKRIDSQQGQTASGAILGTPSYMAPEQAGGKRGEVGPAADVYSLGAILYELLTGRPPFRAETPLDTVLQVVSEEPVPPRRLVPKLPRDLETICLKCLEKAPAKRYASAADLADDLDRWLNTQPIRARRIGPVGRAVRWCRRNPVLATVCALAVVVIGTLTVLYRARLLDENQKTRDALNQTEQERDQATDTLVRSYFEEAQALRLAHRPGWRWQSLDLLREAEKLRARPRRAEQADIPARLPARDELRREAVTALLLEDARLAPPVPIPAGTGPYREISRDGRRLLATFMRQEKVGAPPNSGLRLFDLSDGRQIWELRERDTTLTLPLPKALSPDGTFLAVADRPEIRLLNLPDGTLRATLPALQGPAPPIPQGVIPYCALVFSPDGRYLVAVRASLEKSDLFVWDLRDPAASRHLARVKAWVASMTFQGGGQKLAYPAGGNKLGIIDVSERGEPVLHDLPLPISNASSGNPIWQHDTKLACSPTAPVLAVACTNATRQGIIVFWDIDRKMEQARWDGNFAISSLDIAFSPDGKWLAAYDGSESVRIFDLAKEREVLRLEYVHPGRVAMVQWLADGRLLSVNVSGSAFTTWEPSESPPLSVLVPGKENIGLLAFDPAGRRLAISRSGRPPSVALIERETGKIASQFALPPGFMAGRLCFRPDGEQLALFGNGQVVVRDLAEGRDRAYSQTPPGWRQSAFMEPAFLADGRLLVVESALKDREIRLAVRDIISGREAGPEISTTLEPGINPAEQVGFSPTLLSADGHLLVNLPSALRRSRATISLYDVQSGERLGLLTSPDLALYTLRSALSRDGKWLGYMHHSTDEAGDDDFSRLRLRIWDLANRRHYWDLHPDGRPSSQAFSPDGRLLAVGYENGTVEIWDLTAKELLFQWPALGAAVKHLAFTPEGDYLAASGATAPVHLLHIGELRRRLAEMGLDW